MNCDECKELISVFMDEDVDESRAAAVREHLSACEDCAILSEDFTSIRDVCDTESPSELVPPNSRALWLRINNIIESEIRPEPPPPVAPPRSPLRRLSFAQIAGAVFCIAIISSLLTIVAIRNYLRPANDDSMRSETTQTTFEKFLGKVGLAETPQQARERRLKEQRAAIEYWNARVQTRRDQWDRITRDAFDRNLQVIDESVNEYTMILQQDPEDELSGEILDSVLNDKMNLLREFSGL